MRAASLLVAAAAAVGAHAWAVPPALVPQLSLTSPRPPRHELTESSMTDPLGLPLYIFHHAAQQSTPRPDPMHEPDPGQLSEREHPRDFLRKPDRHQSAPPPGCEITFVDNFSRHGARLPSKRDHREMVKVLKKIRHALAEVPRGRLADPELEFLRTYHVPKELASLVPYGALQAWHKGRLDRLTYSDLVGEKGAFIRASGDFGGGDRVVWTAMYWKLGFDGKPFPEGELISPEDVREQEGLEPPHVLLSEEDGANNTLSVSTCSAYWTHRGTLAKEYEANTLEPVVAARFVRRLAPAKIDLSAKEIMALMHVCTYWTLGAATVTDGEASLSVHPLCRAFETDDWQIYEYAQDLESWENQGHGSPYHRAAGQGYLRELYARLNGSTPPLEQPTSLNSTLDSDRRTFPLPSSGPDGYSFFLDAAHSGTMVPVLSAFGLYHGPAPSSAPGAERTYAGRAYQNSRFMPFMTQAHFQRLTCRASPPSGWHWLWPWATAEESESSNYVRVRVNQLTHPAAGHSWCPVTAGSLSPRQKQLLADGLCPLDAVLAGLEWVNGADEWDKCYDTPQDPSGDL